MEPSLDQIEDYHGNESKEKKNIVNLVIVGLFLVGFVYGIIKYFDAQKPVEIYTPTTEKVK